MADEEKFAAHAWEAYLKRCSEDRAACLALMPEIGDPLYLDKVKDSHAEWGKMHAISWEMYANARGLKRH